MTQNNDITYKPNDEFANTEAPGWKNLETALHQMIRLSLHEQEMRTYQYMKQYYE
jgi:hypothetical protein